MRVIGAVVLIVLVLGACYFIPGLTGHVKQLPNDAARVIDEGASDAHNFGIAYENLNKVEKELFEIFAAIRDVERAMDDTKEATLPQQRELQRNEDILRGSKDFLGQHKLGDKFLVGNVEYTWERLNDESLQRVQKCEVLRKNIESNEKLLARLSQTCERGKKNLAAKQALLKQKRANLDTAKVELALMAREEKIQSLIDNADGIFNAKGNLGSYPIVLKRLDRARDQAQYRQTTESVSQDSEMAWNQQLGIVPNKATDSIATYFGKGKAESAPAPVPAK